MACTNQTWPAIIGLDLGKQTYSGCRLYGESYTKRHNFTGKMTRGEDRRWGSCVRANRKSNEIANL